MSDDEYKQRGSEQLEKPADSKTKPHKAIAERFYNDIVRIAAKVRAKHKRGNLDEKPEAAFRLEFEKLLEREGILGETALEPSKERVISQTGTRLDMLCGRVITEYKAPGLLEGDDAFLATVEQTKGYMRGLANDTGESASLHKYYGLLLDGFTWHC